MIFKLFIFLLPLVFLGCGGGTNLVVPKTVEKAETKKKIIRALEKPKTEMVWDRDSQSDISDEEYNEALKKYVELKYPEKVKVYKQNIITSNGLIWQDNKDAKTVERDWHGAKKYCSNLILFGFHDWRLANKDELLNLYKMKDKLKNLASRGYWSSTTSTSFISYAWFVYFNNGNSNGTNKTNEKYVRCVRIGQ